MHYFITLASIYTCQMWVDTTTVLHKMQIFKLFSRFLVREKKKQRVIELIFFDARKSSSNTEGDHTNLILFMASANS